MKKVLLVGVLLVLGGCSQQKKQTESEPHEEVQQVEKEIDNKQLMLDQLQSQPNLSSLIEFIKPMMEDSVNAMPPAAMGLPLWSEKNKLTWSDINSIPETTIGKILKDSYLERGKRVCVNGFVGEIEVDRSAGFPVYTGGMMNSDMQVIRFLAMKSTGSIISESKAKFCGISVGKMSYDNASGGSTHAPYLVGMFDLPENR